MRVAVLGTGIMGTGVARSLRRRGLEVDAWNRTARKAQALTDAGVLAHGDPADAVRRADAVVLTLFDAAAVLQVLERIAPAIPAGAIVIQSSTIGVDGTARARALAGRAGLTMIEAMMLGSRGPAEEGTLVLLAAGDRSLSDRLRPVFDAMSSRVIWAGPRVGDGTTLKLACNAWLATITAGAAQSIAMAEAMGIQPALFLEAIRGGPSDCSYAQTKGGEMLAGKFEPRFTVNALLKDLGVIEEGAETAGVDGAMIGVLHAYFAKAAATGHGGEDVAAVVSTLRAPQEAAR